MLRLFRLILVGGLGLFILPLGGCAYAIFGAAAVKYYKSEDPNLVQSSYAAADYLLQQSNTYYDRDTPITVLPLSDESRMGLSSRFGYTIGHQVGSRFAQLGYTVDLSDVPLTDETALDVKSLPQKPKIMLSGSYKRARPEMEVNLHITEIESGFRIASFQYLIAYNSDIRKMSDPEIRIMRVR